jgi:hypothetical protein
LGDPNEKESTGRECDKGVVGVKANPSSLWGAPLRGGNEVSGFGSRDGGGSATPPLCQWVEGRLGSSLEDLSPTLGTEGKADCAAEHRESACKVVRAWACVCGRVPKVVAASGQYSERDCGGKDDYNERSWGHSNWCLKRHYPMGGAWAGTGGRPCGLGGEYRGMCGLGCAVQPNGIKVPR